MHNLVKLKYNLVKDDEDNINVTVYHGGRTYVADQSHPFWDRIRQGIFDEDPSVIELFDIAYAVGQRLALSDRVTYASNRLFLDGDDISEGGLARHIVEMLTNGDDVAPFVCLLENILQNPSDNSRSQLYRYIDRNGITITPDGELVLYKYVNQGSTKAYQSSHAGPAIVNGEPHKDGYVQQDLGDIVTMPRSQVVDDPGVACDTGLHVGAWEYVQGSGTVRLEVRVHPRDVVSVPSDYSERKIRTCRYRIIREVTEDYKVPVLYEVADHLVQLQGEDSPERSSDAPTEAPVASGALATGKVKHPSQASFNTMRARAKARRKGFCTYASTVGKWTLLDGFDGTKREHWTV